MRTKPILLSLIVIGAIGFIFGLLNDEDRSRPKSADTAPPADAAAARAQKTLRAEAKIKDVLFQPGQAVEWQVGVISDGTSRVGFANYVCEVLQQEGALKPRTEVRVVDIVKVANGTNFREASLGHVACSDRRVIEP